jgi:hypothetical protein
MDDDNDLERLPPTPQTLKRLFAYSGNQCARPGCRNYLVDDGGTMLGKVAHIHAAGRKGPRFDRDMSNEVRRHFNNLLVLCGACHDIIDDKAREADFPAALIVQWKASHEARFQRAERELVNRYRDATRDAVPTYPTTLHALAAALNEPMLQDEQESIEGIRGFIDKLRGLPLDVRSFAMEVADRMIRLDKHMLLVADVQQALGLDERELKTLVDLLDEHELGDAHEDFNDRLNVRLHDREPGGNPFIEIIQFCDATGCSRDTLLYDLDFVVYDNGRPSAS